MKLPNDTQSTLTPTTHNDNTTGTTEWTHHMHASLLISVSITAMSVFLFICLAARRASSSKDMSKSITYNKGQKQVMIFIDFKYVLS